MKRKSRDKSLAILAISALMAGFGAYAFKGLITALEEFDFEFEEDQEDLFDL